MNAIRSLCLRCWQPLLLPVLLLLVTLNLPTAPVAAQSSTSVIEQQDLDGDGQPNLTILSASFATPNDRVLVYDGRANMQRSSDWREATDFVDDTWIFDRNGDGTAQLLIRFARDGETIRAQIYSDQTGDAIVAVEVSGRNVRVTEAQYPNLIAEVSGDWFLPDGQLNWNVRFLTDGPLRHQHTYELSYVWSNLGLLKLDGRPDFELAFADQERDGIPEYGIFRLLTPTSRFIGGIRTWIWSNEGRQQPAQPENSLFWPYLSTDLPTNALVDNVARPQSLRYFDNPPFISVSFDAATIRLISFEGYPIEQGFHVHTFEPFDQNRINYAGFENIQAYYDLAGDQDNSPELHIRHRYFEANDVFNGSTTVPTNEIRYSWSQANSTDLQFDYKIGLAGRHLMTDEVQIGDFTYRSVAFAEWPAWVNTQRWDYATFVAIETSTAYRSSEGIYGWAPIEAIIDGDETVTSRYLEGDAVDISQAFQSTDIGSRGEFAPDLQDQPWLYLSNVDRKLHLRNASYGIWTIDARSQIRYANLDGDGYLDQWSYLVDGQLQRQLSVTPEHLIYSDDQQVVIKVNDDKPALAEMLPPTNTAEWQAVNRQLDQYRVTTSADDLRALLNNFRGVQLEIDRAQLRDFRRTSASGFRFVLTLQSGYSSSGTRLLQLRDLAPGDYVVTYDGAFRVEPLTPPVISLSLEPGPLTAYAEGAIFVNLQNSGREDLQAATLELAITQANLGAAGVITQTVTLPAGETTTQRLAWVPPAGGDWVINPSLQVAEQAAQVFDAQTVQVNPPAVASPEQLIGQEGPRLSVIAALAALVVGVVLIALLAHRSTTSIVQEYLDGTHRS